MFYVNSREVVFYQMSTLTGLQEVDLWISYASSMSLNSYLIELVHVDGS